MQYETYRRRSKRLEILKQDIKVKQDDIKKIYLDIVKRWKQRERKKESAELERVKKAKENESKKKEILEEIAKIRGNIKMIAESTDKLIVGGGSMWEMSVFYFTNYLCYFPYELKTPFTKCGNYINYMRFHRVAGNFQGDEPSIFLIDIGSRLLTMKLAVSLREAVRISDFAKYISAIVKHAPHVPERTEEDIDNFYKTFIAPRSSWRFRMSRFKDDAVSNYVRTLENKEKILDIMLEELKKSGCYSSNAQAIDSRAIIKCDDSRDFGEEKWRLRNVLRRVMPDANIKEIQYDKNVPKWQSMATEILNLVSLEIPDDIEGALREYFKIGGIAVAANGNEAINKELQDLRKIYAELFNDYKEYRKSMGILLRNYMKKIGDIGKEVEELKDKSFSSWDYN